MPDEILTLPDDATNAGAAGVVYPFIVMGVLVTVLGEAQVALEVKDNEI